MLSRSAAKLARSFTLSLKTLNLALPDHHSLRSLFGVISEHVVFVVMRVVSTSEVDVEALAVRLLCVLPLRTSLEGLVELLHVLVALVLLALDDGGRSVYFTLLAFEFARVKTGVLLDGLASDGVLVLVVEEVLQKVALLLVAGRVLLHDPDLMRLFVQLDGTASSTN